MTQSAPAPFRPDEAWIDAFTEQCTDEMRLSAKRFATRRGQWLAKQRGHGADYAQDLVQSAIVDTLSGVVAWEPTAKSLRQHVEDVIRFRTRHDRAHARKFHHERIDAFADDSEKHAARGELEASLQHDRGGDGSTDAEMFAGEVIAKLRDLAARDRLVLRVLDAIAAGARSRADIMDFTELSQKTYRNARGRLRRLADQLDHQTGTALRRA